jgi:CheY-like chemotaxis protein
LVAFLSTLERSRVPIVARVLLVDDDPQVLELFDKLLTKGGHSVVSTNSGETALGILNTAASIDLMVLDLKMPKVDGFEVLKAARTKWPGLRILVVSGWLDGVLLTPARFLGATFSLNKADAPMLLLQTVNNVLK